MVQLVQLDQLVQRGVEMNGSSVEKWLAQEPEPEIVEPIDCNSLSFLQSIYRDSRIALGVRMRAAIECLPFENPKLSATAIIPGDGDFADKLKRAIIRSRQGPKLIEHSSAPTATIDHRSG
jgi:hypothetical protein